MSYKGTVPKGQPRTLRAIADQKNDSKNLKSTEFDRDMTPPSPYRDDVGMPAFEGRREGAATKRPL